MCIFETEIETETRKMVETETETESLADLCTLSPRKWLQMEYILASRIVSTWILAQVKK